MRVLIRSPCFRRRLWTTGAESAPACALGWPIRSPPLRCNTRAKGNPAPMTASTPLLVTFSIYLFVVVMSGFVAWKSTKDFDDYILGGRSLGPWVVDGRAHV